MCMKRPGRVPTISLVFTKTRWWVYKRTADRGEQMHTLTVLGAEEQNLMLIEVVVSRGRKQRKLFVY